ncbi:MAG: hypothetical protein ACOX8W_00610 [bacterium]
MPLVLEDVRRILDAEIISGEERLERPVATVCASDMMSDVLTVAKEHAILLTSLANQYVIRTAEITDLDAIVFVCGKRPDAAATALARRVGMPLMATGKTMFESCGLLYGHGFRSVAQ